MGKLQSTRLIVRWLWATWRGYRLQALLNAALGIGAVAADLAFVWATKRCIDVATHSRADVSLSSTLVLLGCLMATQILFSFSAKWVRAILGVRSTNRMQRDCYAHLLRCRWRELRTHHSGDLLNRIEKDVAAVVGLLTESIPSFLTTAVQLAGAFVFLFFMDRTLALIILVLVPAFLLAGRLYVRRTRRLTHDIRATESRLQALIQEGLQHLTLIKAMEQAKRVVGHVGSVQRGLQRDVKRHTAYSSASALVMNVGFSAGYLVTFAWGVSHLQTGAITYGAMVAFMQLVGMIQGPARSLTRYVPIFINAATAGERLMELEAVAEEPAGPNLKLGTPVGLRLQEVCFCYAPQGRHVIDHLTHDFRPGSITAVCGETGSGKTTLIRLILALVSPTGGRISLYNNSEEAEVSARTRCNISFVPQGNTLLSGTVRSNLLLGNPDATEADMRAALHTACADFVFDRPEGLDLRCGEGGDGLSEGQAQRISIARALLRPCGLLLLDEATSALDQATEERLVERLRQSGLSCTVLLVTHRPAVLRLCSNVLHLGPA